MTRPYRLIFGIGSALYLIAVTATLIVAVTDHNMFSGIPAAMLTQPWSSIFMEAILLYDENFYNTESKLLAAIPHVVGALLNILIFYIVLRVVFWNRSKVIRAT